VPPVRFDCIHRYVQLADDLPCGQVRRQVTQHPDLAVGKGLEVVRLLAGWRGQPVHAALRRRTWRSSNRVGGWIRNGHGTRSGSARSRARCRAHPAAPGSPSLSRAITPSKNAASTRTRRAAGTSRKGTAVAGRSPWPGCGLATTSQISPAARSPPDRADGLPLPCALDEESLIVAVMSVPPSTGVRRMRRRARRSGSLAPPHTPASLPLARAHSRHGVRTLHRIPVWSGPAEATPARRSRSGRTTRDRRRWCRTPEPRWRILRWGGCPAGPGRTSSSQAASTLAVKSRRAFASSSGASMAA
jgi:hypothetical protein